MRYLVVEAIGGFQVIEATEQAFNEHSIWFEGTEVECSNYIEDFKNKYKREPQSVTYRASRAHAVRCGALKRGTMAQPVGRMLRSRRVAKDILHPETLDVLHSAGNWITPEEAQFLYLHTGIDYIICYK